MNHKSDVSLVLLMYAALTGCGPKEITPVDIYPEDACAHCRMAVSDQRFACEIISDGGEVFKFDDIGCLEEYVNTKSSTLVVAAAFYKDYHSKEWITNSGAVVVETSIATPMGSGKVAFGNSNSADKFRREHPRPAVSETGN